LRSVSADPPRAPDGIVIPFPEGDLVLRHLVLDLNGTVAVDGAVLPSVRDQVARLRERLDIVLVSGDTFGTAGEASAQLGVRRIELAPLAQGTAKLAIVNELGVSCTAVIGNGRNDAPALGAAAVGICVVGHEGAARLAVDAADVVVADVTRALDLLLSPVRLVATLRR